MRAGKIIQHSTPLSVNRPVAFVHDDQLEIIRRKFQILSELNDAVIFFFFIRCISLVLRVLAVIVCDGFTGKHSKELLNSGNNDIRADILFFSQPLDIVEKAHFRLLFRAVKSAEFTLRLFRQIIPVGKEENSADGGIIQQPVACKTGEVCFSGAGRQNRKAFLFTRFDGFFKFDFGAVLAVAQAAFFQSWKRTVFGNLSDQLQHLFRRVHFLYFNIFTVRLKHISEIDFITVRKINQRNLIREP